MIDLGGVFQFLVPRPPGQKGDSIGLYFRRSPPFRTNLPLFLPTSSFHAAFFQEGSRECLTSATFPFLPRISPFPKRGFFPKVGDFFFFPPVFLQFFLVKALPRPASNYFTAIFPLFQAKLLFFLRYRMGIRFKEEGFFFLPPPLLRCSMAVVFPRPTRNFSPPVLFFLFFLFFVLLAFLFPRFRAISLFLRGV